MAPFAVAGDQDGTCVDKEDDDSSIAAFVMDVSDDSDSTGNTSSSTR